MDGSDEREDARCDDYDICDEISYLRWSRSYYLVDFVGISGDSE